ncbi:MAG: sulfite exporter TauE/SafE family protein [Reyranellaceae bacterium]
MDLIHLLWIALIFLPAGLVKGVIGLGLPTIGMGLLALLMPPAEAAALLTLPSLVTNVWQMLAGRRLGAIARRLWPMMLGVCLGTWAGAGLMIGDSARYATAGLGAALILYAIVGLTAFRFSVRASLEPVLAPIVGAITGMITAATGVFVIPAVPYLQGIGLEKDALVQALGLSFTVSTLALAASLAAGGVFVPTMIAPTLVALGVALLGMWLGQIVRERISPPAFRRCFFAGLLLLGLWLMLRAA